MWSQPVPMFRPSGQVWRPEIPERRDVELTFEWGRRSGARSADPSEEVLHELTQCDAVTSGSHPRWAVVRPWSA